MALPDKRKVLDSLLARMNELAAERAHKRAPVSRFKDPEHYRVDARCQRP